jgi:hypothetical protein
MKPDALVEPGCRRLETPGAGGVLEAGIVTSDVDVSVTPISLVRAAVDATLSCTLVDESGAGTSPAVAVLAAERAQVAVLAHALADVDVTVTTFNRAQGQTFDATIVLDPASGATSPFARDPGRLAVALTRHRIRCAFLSAPSDPLASEAVSGLPPWHPANRASHSVETAGLMVSMRDGAHSLGQSTPSTPSC